MLADSFLLSLL